MADGFPLRSELDQVQRERFYKIVSGWVQGDAAIYDEAQDVSLWRLGYIEPLKVDAGLILMPTVHGVVREYHLAKRF